MFKYKSSLARRLIGNPCFVQIAACMVIMKWKQSSILCNKVFLSSISMLNSLSSASWTYTQVLMSMLSFSLFQLVLNVIGTPSHLCGSTCLRRSPMHFMILLHNTWGYKVWIFIIIYFLDEMMMVLIWIVEVSNHHLSEHGRIPHEVPWLRS